MTAANEIQYTASHISVPDAARQIQHRLHRYSVEMEGAFQYWMVPSLTPTTMIPEVHDVGLGPYRKICPMFRLYPGGLVVDAAEL
jgi:hypothetical protein